jgi:hypothetical protein
MRLAASIWGLISFLWCVPALFADIYVWTDANGVKNFTNHAPPEQAVVFMETPEIDAKSPIMQTIVEKERAEAESLQSQQLRAAQQEIESLSDQVAGLRKELRDALEPVYEPPPEETTEIYEPYSRVRYRTFVGSGFWPRYDPYGYLWYHKVKKLHRRLGYGHGGHKKVIPHKRPFIHHGTKKRVTRQNLGFAKHRSGQRTSGRSIHRAHSGGSNRHGGIRGGYRGRMMPRR